MADRVRRQAEDLKEAKRQLVLAGKMSQMGRLAADLAHEINNPLTFMLADLELLAEDLQGARESDDCTALLETVEHRRVRLLHGLRRIETLVRGLRKQARAPSGSAEPVDIHACIDEVLAILECKIRRCPGLEVRREFGRLPPVRARGGELSQVVMNLLDNALSAECAGGTITVSTVYDRHRDVACVSVRDRGRGIDASLLERIFEPFFTTRDDADEGLGLGLSISRSIVEGHDGRIWAENNDDGPGATFHIEIPLETPRQAHGTAEDSPVCVASLEPLEISAEDSSTAARS